jgi:hypothetical protein
VPEPALRLILFIYFLPGFALAELEDGTFALSTGIANLALHNPAGVTQIQFYTADIQVQQLFINSFTLSTIAWVDFGLFFTFSKVPLGFVPYLPKIPTIAKKFF